MRLPRASSAPLAPALSPARGCGRSMSAVLGAGLSVRRQ